MLSVMVVDGDQSFLDLFQRTAQTWSEIEVTTARTEKEAEEYLKDHPCDVVISEYMLPDRDGIYLLRHLRSRYGDLPYMMVTGAGSEAIAAEASRFGISAYIVKGPDPVSLFSEIYGKLRIESRRKDAIVALQEKESRCRAILESQPGFICRIGADMATTYMNPAFIRAMGIMNENPNIPAFPECMIEEDRDRFLTAFQGLTPAQPSFVIKLGLSPLPPGAKSPLWTEWTFTAAFDEYQCPTVIQGTGRDVSWEREHEALQKRQIENLAFLSRTAMEFVDREDSISISDYIAKVVYELLPHSLVGVILYEPKLNATCVESVVGDEDILAAIRQWFHTDLVGMTFPWGQETFAKIDFNSKGIIEGPSLYYFFVHKFPKDACQKIVEQCNLGKTYVAGFTSQGELYGAVTFILRKDATIENPDILEAFLNQASVAFMRWKTRRMADEEIERLNADLEQKVRDRTRNLEIANKNLESFSYSVSHDLRAPLRSIEGFSSIFLNVHGKDLSADGKQLIEKIRQNTVRMADLIDAILEFSRAGRKELQRERIDIQTMAREILDELAVSRPGKQIETAIGNLPPCMADPILMRQVLQNLLSNALKFSRCRDISRIEVGSYDDDGQPVYYVRDNGIGVDMKYADRLFKVFERLHDGKEYEGTGIGLAIVDNIIRRHGGKVWMESGVDKGCTCYFTIGGEE